MKTKPIILSFLFIGLFLVGCASQKDKLYSAIYQHDYATVEKIISSDKNLTNVFFEDKQCGIYPIQVAAMVGDEQILSLLISHKANLTITDVAGWTALHHAAYNNNLKAVEALLNAGVSVDIKTASVSPNRPSGLTPLMMASMKNNIDVIKLLVQRGANPNIQDTDYKTALFYCAGPCKNNYTESFEFLLRSGADSTIKNKKGQKLKNFSKFQDIFYHNRSTKK